VIRLGVPLETVTFVERANQFLEHHRTCGFGSETILSFFSHLIDAGDIKIDRKLRVLLFGYQQRDPGEAHVEIALSGLLCEEGSYGWCGFGHAGSPEAEYRNCEVEPQDR